jgi:uncharacterized protein involved in exopolysaccharide biosynthesis
MISLSLAFFIISQMTASDWAGYAALLTIVVKLFADWINRVQDRLSAESKAKIILEELKAQEIRLKLAAAEREERLKAKIEESTNAAKESTSVTREGIEKSKEALDAANNHTGKLTAALEHVASATELLRNDRSSS